MMFFCMLCLARLRSMRVVCTYCAQKKGGQVVCVSDWWNDIITAVSLIRAIRALVHPVALQLVADAATVRAAKLGLSATCSIHHIHAHLKIHLPTDPLIRKILPSLFLGSFIILQQAGSQLKQVLRYSVSPV